MTFEIESHKIRSESHKFMTFGVKIIFFSETQVAKKIRRSLEVSAYKHTFFRIMSYGLERCIIRIDVFSIEVITNRLLFWSIAPTNTLKLIGATGSIIADTVNTTNGIN